MTDIEKPLASVHNWFIDQARGIPLDLRHASRLGARALAGGTYPDPPTAYTTGPQFGGPIPYPTPSVETQYRFNPSEGPTGLPAFESPESLMGGGKGRSPGLSAADLAEWRATMRTVLARIRKGEIRLWDHGLGLLPPRYRFLGLGRDSGSGYREGSWLCGDLLNLDDPATYLDGPLSFTPFLDRWGAFGSIGPFAALEAAAQADGVSVQHPTTKRWLTPDAIVTTVSGFRVADAAAWLLNGYTTCPGGTVLSLGDSQLPLGTCTIQGSPFHSPEVFGFSGNQTIYTFMTRGLQVEAGIIRSVVVANGVTTVSLTPDRNLWFADGALPFRNPSLQGVQSPLLSTAGFTATTAETASQAGIWLAPADILEAQQSGATVGLGAVQAIEWSGQTLTVTLLGQGTIGLLVGRRAAFLLMFRSPPVSTVWACPSATVSGYPNGLTPGARTPSSADYARHWALLESPQGIISYRNEGRTELDSTNHVTYQGDLPASQGLQRHNWQPIFQDQDGLTPVVAGLSKDRLVNNVAYGPNQFAVSVPPWLAADPTGSQRGGCWSAVPFRPAITSDVPVAGARLTYSVIWEEVLKGCLSKIIPVSRARTPLQELQEVLTYSATNRLGMTELERDLLAAPGVTFHDVTAGRRVFADPWQLLADGEMTDRAVRLSVVANDDPLTAEGLGQLPSLIYEEIRPWPPSPSNGVGIARALFPDGYCGGYQPQGLGNYDYLNNPGSAARGRPAYYRLGSACLPESPVGDPVTALTRAEQITYRLPWSQPFQTTALTPFVQNSTFNSYGDEIDGSSSGADSSYGSAQVNIRGILFPARGTSSKGVGLTAENAVPVAGALVLGTSQALTAYLTPVPGVVFRGNGGTVGGLSTTTTIVDGVSTTTSSTGFTPGPSNYVYQYVHSFSYRTAGWGVSFNGAVYTPQSSTRDITLNYAVGGGQLRTFYDGQTVGGIQSTTKTGSASVGFLANQLNGSTNYQIGTAQGSGNLGASAVGSIGPSYEPSAVTLAIASPYQSTSHDAVYVESSAAGGTYSIPVPPDAEAPSSPSGSATNDYRPISAGGSGSNYSGMAGPFIGPPAGFDYTSFPSLDAQAVTTSTSISFKAYPGLQQYQELDYRGTYNAITLFRNETRLNRQYFYPISQEGGRWCGKPETMPRDVLAASRPDYLVRILSAETVLVDTDALTGRTVQTFILAPNKTYLIRHACGPIRKVLSANQGELPAGVTSYRAQTLGPDILTVRDAHHGVVGYCNVLVIPDGKGMILQPGNLTFPETNPDVSAKVVTALERFTPEYLASRPSTFPRTTYPAGPWYVVTRIYSDSQATNPPFGQSTAVFQKTIQLRIGVEFSYSKLSTYGLTVGTRFVPRVYDTHSLTVLTDYDQQWQVVEDGMWRTTSQALQDLAAVGKVTVVILDTLTGAIL